MAVLQKIRVKFGLAISIIIALALLSFIIDPSTLESALNSMSSKYDVGNIDGKAVSYTDFQEHLATMTTVNEVITGTSSHSEQQQQQINDAAWQSLVDKYLFVKNAKAAGIAVGEEEIVALTIGDMVSPLIAQNPAFADENGVYDPDRLSEFVASLGEDQSGSLRTYWNYIQNTIYTQQYYAKYGSLFTASNFQNSIMLENTIADNNVTADVEFVSVPYGYAIDSTIVVSDAEIKDYYKNHKDFFKQKASRDIEYVIYEVVPSSADIAAVSDSFSEIYEEFSSTEAMKSFLLKNSDRSLSEYWYKEGELATINREVNDFVFGGAKAGETSPIIKNGNTFYAARIMKESKIADSVYVKHILLQGTDAKAKADSLVNVINKGGNFSELVAEYSADKNSAFDGESGALGWMTQTYIIPGFESVITAESGKAFEIDTQYGSHVVLVSKKTAPIAKKQVAILEKETLASKETFNSIYAKANKFATLANGSYANYRAAVDTLGVYSHPMNNISEGTDSYGSIDNGKEITRWAFDAKKGEVSNIITINNNYFFIVALKGIHKEGYATIEEAAARIRPVLYSEKLGEKKAAEIAEKIEGLTTMEAIAEALGTTVSTQHDVAFSSFASQSNDSKFIGAIAGAKEGQISGPVAGSMAAYVFNVISRETGSYYTDDDAKNYEAQRNQYISRMILPVMMENTVTDNRARFF